MVYVALIALGLLCEYRGYDTAALVLIWFGGIMLVVSFLVAGGLGAKVAWGWWKEFIEDRKIKARRAEEARVRERERAERVKKFNEDSVRLQQEADALSEKLMKDEIARRNEEKLREQWKA